MANTISALNSELWAKKMGILLQKALVGRAICEVWGESDLKRYDVINRPYMGDLSVNTYTPGTGVTIQDLSATNEQLSIDQFKEVSFYVDDIENLQSFYGIMDVWSDRATYHLADTVDTAIFAQYTNFTSTDLTNANIPGGTGVAGSITGTTANIQSVFTGLRQLMRQANVAMTGDTFIVLDPIEAELLERNFAASGYSTADATLRNGFAGKAYGVEVFVSNNLTEAASVLHSIGGKKGSISLAVQMEPKVSIRQVDNKLGVNVLAVVDYGIKTFNIGGQQVFDIHFDRT